MQSETVEDWARRYVLSDVLEYKLAPPQPPSRWEPYPKVTSNLVPGRPKQLKPRGRSRSPARNLREPAAQARLLHTFFHHELQAAELMCWAMVRFADAESEFRRGLLGIALDEIRHARAYAEEISVLGFQLGAFPVRDWFWERVPTCATKLQFVALMGMGLEAANLEHARDYAQRLAAAGAHRAARLQAQIEREEVGHVRFGVHWFSRWSGEVNFERWQAALPPPLSPLLMRGSSINRPARSAAGMPDDFIDAIGQWTPPA